MLMPNQIRKTINALTSLLCLGMAGNTAFSFHSVSQSTDEELLAKGALVYRSQCASCHGDEGQGGTKKYAEPLIGDASRAELAQIIADTMPEEDPGSCVGEDAEAVAAFVFDQFYSEAAQSRNRPPRAGLARLTGPQLRQSLADLYSHFRGTPKRSEKRGVRAIYFDGPNWKNEKKKIERIDPVIQFDFGHESPGEGIDSKAFYIYWEGGILANETGRYEIVVRSTCSFVMDFGKIGRELINNHVQSGDKTEFRQTVTLTAGRVYPFKIDFIQRERKTDKPPASVSLSWITPNGIEQVIPTRNLVYEDATPTFSVESELPPDDRSYGFERGLAIDRQWDEPVSSLVKLPPTNSGQSTARNTRKRRTKIEVCCVRS
jgi:cytochrome c553